MPKESEKLAKEILKNYQNKLQTDFVRKYTKVLLDKELKIVEEFTELFLGLVLPFLKTGPIISKAQLRKFGIGKISTQQKQYIYMIKKLKYH